MGLPSSPLLRHKPLPQQMVEAKCLSLFRSQFQSPPQSPSQSPSQLWFLLPPRLPLPSRPPIRHPRQPRRPSHLPPPRDLSSPLRKLPSATCKCLFLIDPNSIVRLLRGRERKKA